MIAYIDAHRGQFGVELICRVLRAAIPGFLTSRGYRAARTRPPAEYEAALTGTSHPASQPTPALATE